MSSAPVSVVIPAYRSARTVVEALDSIVVQTLPPAELIVVDDCSPDDTVAVLDAWIGRQGTAAAFPTTVIRLARNGGPAAARNAGIRAASQPWIAFLDADDASLPERLAVQTAAAEAHPEAALLCGRTCKLNPGGAAVAAPKGGRHPEATPRRLALDEFIAHNPVATSTVMARRAVLLDVGLFDEQFRGPEDYDLWLRVAATACCFDLDVPLARYRHTVGSLSMDERSFLPQVLRVLTKAFGAGGVLAQHPDWRRRAYAEQYSSASWMAHNRGANGVALRYLLRSWLYYTGKVHKEATSDPFLRLKLLWRYVTGHKPDAGPMGV